MTSFSSNFSSNDILPAELLAHVFSYLSPQDLLNIKLVNKLWAQIATKPYLWQDLIKQYFPYLIKQNKTDYENDPQTLFKNEFHRFVLEFDMHLKDELKIGGISSLKPYILTAIRGEVERIEKFELANALEKILFCIGAANGHGACLKQLDRDQKTAALIMAIQYRNLRGVELLFQALNKDISYKSPILQIAAQSGDLDIFRFLCRKLQENDDELVASRIGEAFQKATTCGHLTIVQEICSQFSQALTSEDKKSAMLNAALKGQLSTLRWLLNEFQADVDTFKDIFIGAAEKGHLEIIQELLLNHRLNISEHTIRNGFMKAAGKGKATVVRELLLQAGQHVTCEIVRSSAHEAIQKGYFEVLKELYNLSSQNMIKKKRILIDATKNGHQNIVEYCLNSGEIDAITLGQALSNAAKNGYQNIFSTLINYYLTISPVDQKIAINTSLKDDNGITKYCLIHCGAVKFSAEQLDAISAEKSTSNVDFLPRFNAKNKRKRGLISNKEVTFLLQEAETFLHQKRKKQR